MFLIYFTVIPYLHLEWTEDNGCNTFLNIYKLFIFLVSNPVCVTHFPFMIDACTYLFSFMYIYILLYNIENPFNVSIWCSVGGICTWWNIHFEKKMKNNKYHTVGTVPKSNGKMKKKIPHHDSRFSGLSILDCPFSFH